MKLAITRHIADSINKCQLVELDRTPIDLEKARSQHAAYCDLLIRHAWTVTTLPAVDAWPDSVFVEDTAVVFNECAIVTRPGAESRRNEPGPIEEALKPHRPLLHITDPGTLDGGDVIIQGKRVWIGHTTRTNAVAIAQMRDLLTPFGYTITAVPVAGCLHLKSAATAIGENHMAINPEWVDSAVFDACQLIETPRDEPSSANVLDLGDVAVVASAFPKMRTRLEDAGINCESVDADELAKAEGALTCCSLLVGS